MVKVPKVSTGISLPKPIMDAIDAAASRWFCDRGTAITRIVQEWETTGVKQLPLADASTPESEAETMRRLKVQEFPQLVNATDLYLGTGPGDEAA